MCVVSVNKHINVDVKIKTVGATVDSATCIKYHDSDQSRSCSSLNSRCAADITDRPPFISVDRQMDREPLWNVIRPSSCQSSMNLETLHHSHHASPSSLITDLSSSRVPGLFQLQLDYDTVSLRSVCYTPVASSCLSSTVSTFSRSS